MHLLDFMRVLYHNSRAPSRLRTIPCLAGRGSIAVESSLHLSHLRPDYVSSDIVPTKAEVIAVVGIQATLQQGSNRSRTCKATPRVPIIPICQIPKQVVSMDINKRTHLFAQLFVCRHIPYRFLSGDIGKCSYEVNQQL